MNSRWQMRTALSETAIRSQKQVGRAQLSGNTLEKSCCAETKANSSGCALLQIFTLPTLVIGMFSSTTNWFEGKRMCLQIRPKWLFHNITQVLYQSAIVILKTSSPRVLQLIRLGQRGYWFDWIWAVIDGCKKNQNPIEWQDPSFSIRTFLKKKPSWWFCKLPVFVQRSLSFS